MAVTSIQIRNYEYYVLSSRGSSDPANAVILLYEANNTRIASLLLEHPVRVWVPNVLPVHGRGTINVTNDIVRLCVRLLETAGSGPRIAHATQPTV
jgi:hypothetical protein